MQKLSMLALRDLFWIFFCFALNFDVFESDMRRVFLALYGTYQVRIVFTNRHGVKIKGNNISNGEVFGLLDSEYWYFVIL